MKISIVVPTFNEGNNPVVVAETLIKVLHPLEFELIFVDDSTSKESVESLEHLCEEFSWVRYEHREHERSLGTAVVRGFELARGELIAVMDSDMQHPPELLKAMIAAAEIGCDIVIPSRFVPGGDDGGLSPSRKLISWVARVIGQATLKRVRSVTDPTSGFFLLRRSVVENVRLRPIGWKVLIEILVHGNYARIVEIPYRFQPRIAGSSNMSLREQWNYLKHIFKLIVSSSEDRRKYVFAAVGISGVLVNMLVYVGLVKLHMDFWQAGVLAGAVAMVSNFVLNDRLTWHDSRSAPGLKRFGKYVATSLTGIGIDAMVLSMLAYGMHVDYFIANGAGIFVAMIWNFYINNVWTWKAEYREIEVALSCASSSADSESLRAIRSRRSASTDRKWVVEE